MARRRKGRREKRYEDMTDEEWRDWGEKFGKRMAKKGADFGEEMAELGERFGRRMERRGRGWEERRWGHRWKNWWFETFGFVGPLIGSIIGLVFLVIGVFVLKFFNFFLGSSFVSAITDFLFTNLGLFFAIFLFSSYNEYFSKKHWENYWIVTPITTGISLVIAFWIIAAAITLINTVPKFTILSTIANFISANLLTIFVVVFVIGYVVVVVRKMVFDLAR